VPSEKSNHLFAFVFYFKPLHFTLVLNNRCFFLCILMSFVCAWITPAFAQTEEIDSLQRLSSNLSGTEKVDALNKLALALFPYDQSRFAKTVNEAIALSEELKYDKGKSQALIYLANREFQDGKSESSIRQLKESIRLSAALRDSALRGYGLVQLGRTYQNLDLLDSALYCFNLSYEVLKDSLHPAELARVYFSLADYYGLRNQYDKQLSYLQRCLNIRQALKDKSMVWVSIRIATYYTDRNEYDKANTYLDEAQRSLGKDTIGNETIHAIYAQRAIVLVKTGNYPKALNLFNEARKYYEQNGFQKELANLLLNIGLSFDSMGNYEASLKNFFEAMVITEKNHYSLEQIKLESGVGWAYYRLKQFRVAEEYVRKAISLAEKNNHQLELSAAYNLMGLIENELGHPQEAFEFLNQALSIREKLGDQLRVAATLFNIGRVHEKQGDLNKSLYFQLKSLAIQEASNNLQGMAYSYHRIGVLLTNKESYQKAEEYLNKAEQIAKTIKARFILVTVFEAQRDLSVVTNQLPKAISYTRFYEVLKDSIFNEGLSSRISVMENMHELQQKEQQIQLLSQQKKIQDGDLQIQRAQIRQQQLAIIFAVFILILVIGVAIVVFLYYKKVKSLNTEITERNEEIQAQSEELVESNSHLFTLNKAIQEQKEEILAQSEELLESNQTISELNHNLEEKINQRTAELKEAYKELDIFFYRSSHDFRRPLTTFMGLAEVAKITIKDTAALELFERVNETARNLDKMLYKLQSVSDVGAQEIIYKEVFMRDIFEMELNEFKEELTKKEIQTSISVKISKPFYSYHALVRIIVQNLIENAVRFCIPSSATIQLNAFENGVEVIVEVVDNGQGIEPSYKDRVFEMYFRANENSKGNGLGLYIVKKTVQKLNGRVELESVFGSGTTVRVTLPNRQM